MMAMVNSNYSNSFNNYSNQNNYLIQTVPSIQQNEYETNLTESQQQINCQNQSSSPIQSYQDQPNQYYYQQQLNQSNQSNYQTHQYYNQEYPHSYIEYHVKQEYNNNSYEYQSQQQQQQHQQQQQYYQPQNQTAQISINIENKNKRTYEQMSPSHQTNNNYIMTSPIQNSTSYYCPNSPNSPNSLSSTSSLYHTFNIGQMSQPPSPQFITPSNSVNSSTNNLKNCLSSTSQTNLLGSLQPSPMSEFATDEELEEQFKEFLSPSITNVIEKEQLSNLINDYLNEEIPIKSFLSELKDFQLLNNSSSLLNNLIELLLILDSNNGGVMLKFLKDNGVDENDLSIDKNRIQLLLQEFENGLRIKDKSLKKTSARGLRNPPNKWTKEESAKLIQLVHENGDKQWKKIAVQIGGGKTGAQCAQHWKRVLCPAIRKGSWDEEEEAKLFILVEKHGQSWKNIASEIRTRTDIQCRYQYFKSCMSREVPWSAKEDEILQKKVIESKQDGKEIGWMDLSKSMARARQTKIPRTALECKIRWECISMGSIIDGLHDNISSNF